MPHYGGADLPELAAIVEPGPVTQVGTALGDEPVDDLWREQGRHVDGRPDAVSPDSQLTDHAHALAGQYGVARAHLGDRLLHQPDPAPDVRGNVLGREPVDRPAHRFARPDRCAERPLLRHTVGGEVLVQFKSPGGFHTSRGPASGHIDGPPVAPLVSIPRERHFSLLSVGATWLPLRRHGAPHPAGTSRDFRSAIPRWASAFGM